MRDDLKKHLAVGVALGFLGGLAHPALGVALAAIVGAGKELLWDKALGKGTPAWDDAVFTASGGLGGAWLASFLMYLARG